MTLYKQLALLLSLLLTLILTTVMIIVFSTRIDNAERQLHIDAQNTASSLSLSLATAKGDVSTMSTMINANFDSGHYRMIGLEDMKHEGIYERFEDTCRYDVPGWFVDMVTLDAAGASAQVSSGWMVIGTLYVESDHSETYVSLYDSFKSLLIVFAIYMIVSLSVLHIVLYTILQPLRELRRQAEAISQNEFHYQEKLPYTKELREIVLSMNAMVKKIETNFRANAQLIQQNHQKLYTENLPKLYNEHYLMLKCNEECMSNSEYDGGAVIVFELKIEDAAAHESYLLALASIMIEKSHLLNSLVARIKEGRLVLLMPGAGVLLACKVKEEIRETFDELIKAEAGDKQYTVIDGMYRFERHEKCQDFLAKAIENLTADQHDVCMHEREALRYKEQLTQEDWNYLITTALRKELYSYEVRNVIDVSSNRIYDRGITIVMRDNNGNIYPYGRFIAAAVKANKVLDIYMQVIKVLVQNFSSHDKRGRYTFSFSNALLLEEKTFPILQQEFENFENTHELDFCIELPESFVVGHPARSEQYIGLLKTHGYRFGIGEFSAESDDLEYLKTFKPEYVKISKLFLLDMIEQSSPLLSSLQMATDALDIKIIATGVSDEDELSRIKAAGITIVQGYITEVI